MDILSKLHLRRPARSAARIACLLLTVAVILPGCQRGGIEEQKKKAPLPEGEQSIRMTIYRDPSGGTLALVPVHINGKGPYMFALDTGASHSTVRKSLADRLGLPDARITLETTGVVGQSKSDTVRVDNWRAGDVKLRGRVIVSLNMPEVKGRPFELHGLLGSDVLSDYGVVRINYDGRVLTLSPRRAGATQE